MQEADAWFIWVDACTRPLPATGLVLVPEGLD
jgi:hypothetical protein